MPSEINHGDPFFPVKKCDHLMTICTEGKSTG